MDDLEKAASTLFDKYFKTDPTSYAVVFNHRHNSNFDRNAVIEKLASIVQEKNKDHKVNLNNPSLTIVVEVMKNICGLAVVQDYFRFSKYNLHSVCGIEKNEAEGDVVADKTDNPTGDGVNTDKPEDASSDYKDTDSSKNAPGHSNDARKPKEALGDSKVADKPEKGSDDCKDTDKPEKASNDSKDADKPAEASGDCEDTDELEEALTNDVIADNVKAFCGNAAVCIADEPVSDNTSSIKNE